MEGLEAVRKRPAMYIGDVSTRGLHHLVYEVIDNSVDEALAGHCTEISAVIHKDNSVSVTDNGRGIPVGMHPKENVSALEVVMTMLHAGGKFDKGSYKVSGGLHGVGVSCVNALSVKLEAGSRREGHLFRQEYAEGKPVTSLQKVRPLDEGESTGTTIHFWPDASIFNVTSFRFETLSERMRELAYLNAGLRISLEDRREQKVEREVYHYEGGIRDFIAYLDDDSTAIQRETIYIVNEDATVEVAMRYNSGFSVNVLSFVNNINTHQGGTHVSGFRKALTKTLKGYALRNSLLRNFKGDLKGEDFREGLTAVLSVKVASPQFEGQTKTRLGNSEVQGIVQRAVGDQLKRWLEDNPKVARRILSKVVLAAEARAAARKARELVQRKNAFTTGGLPGKLADCASKVAEDCELYLVEGDSAGGSAKQARDRHFQAILPLRGKILNVEKSRLDRVLRNEEIKNIITALGAGIATSDEDVNLGKLRYHKVLLMTDADVDGAHIRTLLLTFFYRHLRPLVEQGHVFIALPPLYKARIGKAERYCWSDSDLQRALAELQIGKSGKPVIQRYKGLGEMNPGQLWDTTMDPETRQLQRVTIEDAAEADRIFSTLMGEAVGPRREFIEKNARYATLDV